MKHDAVPMNKKLWTPVFTFGVLLILVGAVVALIRFVFGIGAVTNLSDGYPWGIWIAWDVATGVPLASGGFTLAFLVYILNKGKYHPLVRPAVLTAMVGYAMAGSSIMLDIGRYWQLYSIFINPQGNSALFEVAMCVTAYLTVLIIEFLPVLTNKFRQDKDGILKSLSDIIEPILDKTMILFILLGITIPTLHQSSLGTVLLLMPYKLHPLWYTYWMPAFFLLSAICVGYPMVVFESMLAASAFDRKSEMNLLTPLTKITAYILLIYVAGRVIDLIYRGFPLGAEDAYWASTTPIWIALLIFELSLFAIPMIMLFSESVRNNPKSLFFAAILMILAVTANRFITYLIAMKGREGFTYFPSIPEFMVSVMLTTIIFVAYKVVANYFPLLEREH